MHLIPFHCRVQSALACTVLIWYDRAMWDCTVRPGEPFGGVLPGLQMQRLHFVVLLCSEVKRARWVPHKSHSLHPSGSLRLPFSSARRTPAAAPPACFCPVHLPWGLPWRSWVGGNKHNDTGAK